MEFKHFYLNKIIKVRFKSLAKLRNWHSLLYFSAQNNGILCPENNLARDAIISKHTKTILS